ncbi:ABC transporter substrate-binding protein [Actinosynnema sp. ALI-1.44]|uniref:ABC transporter substrate-binding protein n=1 Tax=Actinosynnema sp. ALI-1.44 TaxID=1933779 RepID=UPI000A0707D9|nr:ABC transporter substrate-binding protein [Actinosynnema sp. ALI-1.44]
MTVSRPQRLIAALAVALTMASGCAAETNASGQGSAPTRVVKADNGDITIPADPKRVIATGYAVPVLIESDAALVGISTWKRGLEMMTPEHRAKYDKVPKVAGELAAETNYEAIAAAKPDLIVIGVPKPVLADIDLNRLKSVAPVVAIGPNVPYQWRELSRRQADAAGRAGNFDAAKAAYDKKAGELKAKYAGVLKGLKFGHVGGYGDVSAGNFQREFAGSWGTNVGADIGMEYYGEVKKKGPGSQSVSETPSIEELPQSFGQADAVTYTLEPNGQVGASVKYVLDSPLWKDLPAVKAGRTFAVRYTQASTYPSAMFTLDSLDKALAPMLTR